MAAITTALTPHPLVKMIDAGKLNSVCGEAGMQFINECSAAMPFSSYNMLELRLSGEQPEIDLSINYQKLPLEFEPGILNNPRWDIIHKFFSNWNTEGTPEHTFVNDIWIELDYNISLAEISPILFCTLTSLPKNKPLQIIAFIESCFREYLSEKKKQRITNFLNLLPAGSTVSHIAYMQGRPGNPTRFNIKNLNLQQLSSILEALEAEQGPAVTHYCSKYIPLSDSFTLAVDISEIIEPRIGIEFFFAEQQRDYHKINTLSDALVADHLAGVEKARKIKDWPSIEIIPASFENYPENLLRLSRFLYPDAVCSFWNIINHIKLVFDKTGIEAKAYLAYGHSCNVAGSGTEIRMV